MRGQIRKFLPGTWEHIYRRSCDGGLLFYSVRDRLVYFSIASVVAKKYQIEVMGLCLMIDHIHELIRSEHEQDRICYERDTNAWFAKAWNESCGRKGPVFETYGSAWKRGEKQLRTAFAYLANNGPERKLTKRAEDYQWNFLAYAVSDHPFSCPLSSSRPSAHLRWAIEYVDSLARSGRPLTYPLLDRMFDNLNEMEQLQLTDHIVCAYNVIDYQVSISLYGSYETLLQAVNSNTGAEYEIKESFCGVSDREYLPMLSVMEKKFPSDPKAFLGWDVERRLQLLPVLRNVSYARTEQISKFLHLKLRRM